MKTIQTLLHENKKSFPFINIALLLVLAIMVGVYLSQINTTTKIGLELESLETQKEVYAEKQHDLQLEIAEYQSMVYIEERVADLQLAEVDQISYARITPPAVVAKR